MATNYVYKTSYGNAAMLNLKRGPLNGAGWLLGIFVNAPVLAPGLVLGGLVEASFPGYNRQPLTNFGPAATNAAPPNADSTDAVHTFTCTGPGSTDTYQGWFVVDNTNQLVMLGYGNVGAPLAFDANGKFINIQPRITEANYGAYP
jgi:hypothetical protein